MLSFKIKKNSHNDCSGNETENLTHEEKKKQILANID